MVVLNKKLSVIQSLWIGKKLSAMEQLSITSFIKSGHPFHLYVYDDVEGVPDCTILRDANEIIHSNKIFKYRDCDSYAGFSNLFRYRLLLDRGGYWVDTDVVCLKPFQFSHDYQFVNVLKGRPFFLFGSFYNRKPFFSLKRRYYVNTWFIKAPQGCELMQYCYDESAKRNSRELLWGETGPKLFTAAVKKFSMQKYIAPYETFCSINEWQWRQFISGSYAVRRKWSRVVNNSYAVHLYNEMWHRNNIDKNTSFHVNSIYEQLKRCYFTSTSLSNVLCNRSLKGGKVNAKKNFHSGADHS